MRTIADEMISWFRTSGAETPVELAPSACWGGQEPDGDAAQTLRTEEAACRELKPRGWRGFSCVFLFVAALFVMPAQAAPVVTLAWDSSGDASVVGYNVYYGTTSPNHGSKVMVGNSLTATISNLLEGTTYYFIATARNASGVESVPSNEVSYQIPSATLPTVALTSPLSGAGYTAPATVPLAASVTANGQVIAKVQFYSGINLLGEDTSSPYSLGWNSSAAGSHSLTARAVYGSGSTVSSTPVVINISLSGLAATTIWPITAVPVVADGGADGSVELGVKFRSDTAGLVTGIRFYKSSANTGTHTGNLWSSTGSLLGSAVFTSETASGWQQVLFPAPVAIASNTVYVASYHANNGHYSADQLYFSGKGQNNPPLQALATGVSGANGVYAYGANRAFPNQTWNAANYWVDVVFQAGAAVTLVSIAVTPAGPTIGTGGTQPFTAIGTYTDGSQRTLSGQVAWTSSNPDIASVSPAGTATGLAPGSATIGATVAGKAGTALLTVQSTPAIVTLTSPANGVSYSAPATINLAASVAANGHTITKVQFYRGGTLLGEDASAPYSLVWYNVATGNYTVSARVLYDSNSTANSPSVTVTVTGLPSPWLSTDIGAVGLPGGVGHSNGVFTLTGAGRLGGTADSFRYVYQALSANGEIKARLSSVTTAGLNGRTGLMIRENLTPQSKYAFMGLGGDLGFRWQRRSSTGGSTSSSLGSTGTPPNTWVRLVRTNRTLYGYSSTNGVNWTLVGSRSISMATQIFVGLAVASGDANTLGTSVFSNLTVVP